MLEGGLRTFIDTPNVRDNRWRQPLVDEDWNADCQAICDGTEGDEVGKLDYNCVEIGAPFFGQA